MNAAGIWVQLGYLGIAFVLSTLIGAERQIRQKWAGMRTHALVGLGAALFMEISKYGFDDVLEIGLVRLDPSRVAAQIITGIGFIGAGLIVMRRGAIRGLTTAASVWVTCAIGMAAGAGMIVVACVTTAAYFLAIVAFPWLTERIPALRERAPHRLAVLYVDGTGALRDIVSVATDMGYTINGFEVGGGRIGPIVSGSGDGSHEADVVRVEMEVVGRSNPQLLMTQLTSLPHVVAATSESPSD